MPAQPLQLRSDFSSDALRRIAETTKTVDLRSRLFAMAQIYDGHPRSYVAETAGVSLQTLRTWVARFNAGGPDALRNNFNIEARPHNRMP